MGVRRSNQIDKANKDHQTTVEGKLGQNSNPVTGLYAVKLSIGTYCALLWSLFGKKCDYYKELLKIHRILDREECFTI